MAEFPEFPRRLMREVTVDWNIMGAVGAGGQSDAGAAQLARLDGGGLWVAKLNDIQFLDDDDMVRAFKAIRIIADNGSQTLIVPRHEVLQPWPVVDGVEIKSSHGITHSDGSTFSDGAGYAQDVIDMVNVGAVALRAVSMTVLVNVGSAPSGAFSIEHDGLSHHIYEIGTSIDNGDGTYAITFRPPLREAIEDGTKLNFDQPKCCMRLLTQDAMAFKLGTLPYLPQSAAFIESNVSAAE